MTRQWFYNMDEDGETPMSRAFKSGHGALTDFVLRQEREDAPDTVADDTPLQRAAYWGLREAVTQLIHIGADPCELDRTGEPALHKAVRHGHRDVVEMMVGHGANVDERNKYGMTSLHWTALNGRADVAKTLLEWGADANARDEYTGGLTPYAIAKLMGYEQVATEISYHGGTY